MTQDPIVRACAVADHLREQGIPVTKASIEAAFRALEQRELHERRAEVPDAPSATNVLRAAHDAFLANPAVSYENHLRILGEARIQASARRLSALAEADPTPRMTTAEAAEMVSSYGAPNGYEAGLKALQEHDLKALRAKENNR
jgi:hypothetical protein